MNNLRRIPTLRSYITIVISLIVTIILLCSTLFYYVKTSSILTEDYKESVTRQLGQVNQQFTDQIDSIDSIIPLFLSNSLILDALEATQSQDMRNSFENQFYIERQMSYIYYSTALASKNFTNSIYITGLNDMQFSISTSGLPSSLSPDVKKAVDRVDRTETRLICKILPSDDGNLYFIRNLFSVNTGKYTGTFVINIDRQKWMNYCSTGVDPAWFICLFNSELNIVSNQDMSDQSTVLQQYETVRSQKNNGLHELTLRNENYFVASQNLPNVGLISAVCAPKNLLFKDLQDTLQSYLFLLSCTILVALCTAIVISRAITRPIEKMVFHISEISKGGTATLPPMNMYYEFQVWAASFNDMLKKLDIYYTELYQKKLLLKNAELQALQSQMDPHFLLNVLNTMAWKSQMSGNEELYQMVISLGELLKTNILSKERDSVALSQEMEYVKFYVYLQQMRFEDKISCDIQVPDSLLHCKIPCFSIQPLVENAIVHGLEPKKGTGKLVVLILEMGDYMEISIIDNGIGFSDMKDVQNIWSSSEDTHTHIGLRNLDKRLLLLFGPESRLKIDSVPNKCTTVSFKIPIRRYS